MLYVLYLVIWVFMTREVGILGLCCDSVVSCWVCDLALLLARQIFVTLLDIDTGLLDWGIPVRFN